MADPLLSDEEYDEQIAQQERVEAIVETATEPASLEVAGAAGAVLVEETIEAHEPQAEEEAEVHRRRRVNRMANSSFSDSQEVGSLSINITECQKRRLDELLADPYIAYKITTSASQSVAALASGEYVVWRRFSEFEKLFNYLQQQYVTVIMPPMPPKRGHQSWTKVVDNFDADFIERRRVALQAFLRRVARHPQLNTDGVYLSFLEAENWTTQTHSLMRNLDEKMKQMAAKLQLSQPDERVVDMSHYAESLGSSLAGLLKVHDRMATRLRTIYSDYGNFGGALADWSAIEKSIGNVVQSFGHFMDNLSLTSGDSLDDDDEFFATPLREYMMYAETLQTQVRRQETKLYLVEKLKHDLVKTEKEASFEQTGEGGTFFKSFSRKLFGPDSPEAQQQKMQRLETQKQELEMNIRLAEREEEAFSTALLQELDLFNRMKMNDLKTLLLRYAKNRVIRHKKQLSSWQNLRSKIDTSGN